MAEGTTRGRMVAISAHFNGWWVGSEYFLGDLPVVGQDNFVPAGIDWRAVVPPGGSAGLADSLAFRVIAAQVEHRAGAALVSSHNWHSGLRRPFGVFEIECERNRRGTKDRMPKYGCRRRARSERRQHRRSLSRRLPHGSRADMPDCRKRGGWS